MINRRFFTGLFLAILSTFCVVNAALDRSNIDSNSKKVSQENLETTKRSRSKYDYIIVGNGTAGAVLARKLSDHRRNHVLVLEAGVNLNNDPVVQNPNFLVNFNTLIADPKYSFTYSVPLFQLNQFFTYSTGRGWGGSSMHNFMTTVRGTPSIYNGWATLSGDSRWSYNNVLPYMQELEHYTSNGSPINTTQRGTSGPLFISQGPAAQTDPWILAASGPAGAQVGTVIDYNDPTQGVLGFSSQQTFTTPGINAHRSFSANAFLPVGEVIDENGRGLHGRNLRIVSKAFANKVLFRGHRAVGIEFVVNQNGRESTVRVYGRKIILSAGSVETPAILERSGIGDPAVLELLGIPVRISNSNVGNHAQNHYGVEALVLGGSKLNPALGPNITGFTDGRPYYTDGIRRFQFFNIDITGTPLYLLAGVLLDPNSEASVHIVSTDPLVRPRIDFNMFSDGPVTTPFTDANLATTLYRVMNNMVAAAGGTILFPPAGSFADATGTALLNDAKSPDGLFIEDHICGTTRMATSKSIGVVDGKLRVFDAKNLYIADNGVVPIIENGNTAYTAYVIGLTLAAELNEKHHSSH
jgi:choline dehydrogenase